MGAADFLIPPALGAKQALRLRRVGLAALGHAFAAGLVAVGWAFGVLAPTPALEIVGAYAAISVGMYTAIRSGFNLRFRDPSLTTFQILAAISILMFAVFHMDEGRNIALFGCFVVMLFGIYRLDARGFAGVMLYTLAAYALVLNLLMHLRPTAIRDVRLEWLSWLGLAGLLVCFAIIGGQINSLRRRLRESQARFRSLTEMSSDFYWESDSEHRLILRTLSNQTGSIMPPFGPTVGMGERRWEVPSLSPDEAGWLAHRAVLDAHAPVRDFEFSRLGPDGSVRFISISADPLLDASGAFRGYRGVGRNITAQKRSDQALRDSAEKLRLFADNVPALTTYWDETLHCRFANRVFTEFWGIAAGDIVGKRMQDIYSEEMLREVEGPAMRALQGHSVTYARTRVLADGECRHLEVRLVPQTGDAGKVVGYFAVTTDITEHKLAEARMQRAAHHDSLTGLPNRLLFHDRLEQAIALARRNAGGFSLLYLDLDRFKPVNDTYGHDAGDELLKAVAARIRLQVRESDTFARVGGDEFAVILPGVGTREDAQAVAGKIAAAVAAAFRLGGAIEDVCIGASVGIAVYPDDAPDADGLVKAADSAMYDAKQARTGVGIEFSESRL